MKKNAIIFLTILTITSCNNRAPINNAEREKDSLQVILNQRDSNLKNYLISFNEIEKTLDSINMKQNNIYLKTEKVGDIKTSVKDEIRSEIKALNNLIEKNRSKIKSLNATLKLNNGRNKQLDDAIKTLNEQLSKKEGELISLNDKLTGLNFDIGELQASIGYLDSENSAKDDIIAADTDSLHKVYYIIGTTKELIKKKVIDQKGGLIGIGKTTELNKNFDATQFTQIDYTTATIIPINNKKIALISIHPTSSYKLEKEKDIVKAILITNPQEFWKVSKYLVVQISN